MKKILCLLCAAVLLCSLCACTGTSSDNTQTESDGSAAASPAETTSDDKATSTASGGIDVDLTTMSSTMIYSEVLNMTQTPKDYIGKIVRMKGTFSVSEMNGNRYFACIIKDATACCAQGIEFDRGEGYSYPDDYPEKDAEITVTGTFTTYKEDTSTFLQLKDAKLEY